MELPVDVLVEIFSNLKNRYSEFRCLNRTTNKVLLLWDGWDSLVEQGIYVDISPKTIIWFKNGSFHRWNLPAIEGINGDKMWFRNGDTFRESGLPVIESEGKKYWEWSRAQIDELDRSQLREVVFTPYSPYKRYAPGRPPTLGKWFYFKKFVKKWEQEIFLGSFMVIEVCILGWCIYGANNFFTKFDPSIKTSFGQIGIQIE